MNSILASSLNVELVYIILKSVSSFSKNDGDNTEEDADGVVMSVPLNQEKIMPIDLTASADQIDSRV
jgi:hypothetical protein